MVPDTSYISHTTAFFSGYSTNLLLENEVEEQIANCGLRNAVRLWEHFQNWEEAAGRQIFMTSILNCVKY